MYRVVELDYILVYGDEDPDYLNGRMDTVADPFIFLCKERHMIEGFNTDTAVLLSHELTRLL